MALEIHRSAWALVALILTGAALAWCSPPARGDELEPAEAIGALLVHEAGDSRRDWAATWLVLRNRARAGDWTLMAAARRYTSGRLSAVLRAPRVRRSPVRAAAVAAARAWLRRDPDNPCDGRPDQWGSRSHPVDVARAARAVEAGRWRRLRCGPTRQDYYEVRGLRL